MANANIHYTRTWYAVRVINPTTGEKAFVGYHWFHGHIFTNNKLRDKKCYFDD